MILVRFMGYVMFGFFMEVCFVAISKIIDGKIRGRDVYLEGHTYLWMVPVYGFLLLLIFEPVHGLIENWNILARWFIWAITFTYFEALAGYIYDKILGFCPWDYSESKYKMFKRGYTKWTLLPQWGIAGLVIELYSRALIKVSPAFWQVYQEALDSLLNVF